MSLNAFYSQMQRLEHNDFGGSYIQFSESFPSTSIDHDSSYLLTMILKLVSKVKRDLKLFLVNDYDQGLNEDSRGDARDAPTIIHNGIRQAAVLLYVNHIFTLESNNYLD